ncbi:hypothetical protein [Paenibacillus alkalitolerans]|uniref:hypothetical protein n=1 Tax=Paenibacillus alkalitolerans TaxID=2799335 RepID=UPI0018F7038E|nr:hypothetical protein [Paenibacillus alkalitolerans]
MDQANVEIYELLSLEEYRLYVEFRRKLNVSRSSAEAKGYYVKAQDILRKAQERLSAL